MIKKMPFALTVLLTPSLLVAGPDKNANHHSHKTHVHGMAEMTLALEKKTLEVLFKSPAGNLIGFEHRARTAGEKHVVKQTEALLKSPEKLFSFIGADCEPHTVTVDTWAIVEKENDKHTHHENHSEITASYHFNCDSAKQLTSVSITLFEQFPDIEKINAMWVTESQQGADTLSAKKNMISFR